MIMVLPSFAARPHARARGQRTHRPGGGLAKLFFWKTLLCARYVLKSSIIVSAGAKIPIVPVEFSPPPDVVHRSLLRMEEVPRLVKGERRARTKRTATPRDEYPGDQ